MHYVTTSIEAGGASAPRAARVLFHNRHSQTPFASAYGYLIPGVSLALSLPTLTVALVLIYHAVTGYVIGINIHLMPISPFAPAVGFLYIVYGPMLGGLLCVTQRARRANLL